MKTKKTFLVVIALALICFNVQVFGQTKGPNITITFDTSSIEKVLLDPEEVLKDTEGFWKTEPAYVASKRFHDAYKMTIDMDAWKKQLEENAKVPKKDRKNNKYYKFIQEILAKEKEFKTKGIQFMKQYLPENTPDFTTNVIFIDTSRTGGFASEGVIVIDVTNGVSKDANAFYNTLMHELCHQAQMVLFPKMTEIEVANKNQQSVLIHLMTDGLASYTAYKAQELYTFDTFYKYKMLEDIKVVSALPKDINDFFSQAATLSDEEYFNMQEEVGYGKEAYYVFGAYMAKMIDEKLGRKALTDTLLTGPRSFVSIYNSIASPEMKIVEFEAPKTASFPSLLKKAYMGNDMETVNNMEREFYKQIPQMSESAEGEFNALGYALIRYKMVSEAVRVLKMMVAAFPKSANAYDSLGEAYLSAGDKENAKKNYEMSLKLNPENANAKAMLEKINQK